MPRPHLLSAVALPIALSASGVAAPVEDKSWDGKLATQTDEKFTGKLLFAKGKLFLNPGTPEERSFAPGEIKQVNFIGAENAGTQPVGKRKFQPGLFGEYFVGLNFDGGQQTRIDRVIDFTWNQGAPLSGIAADNFSVRWTGEVKAPITGKVSFHATSDDGVRVWVNGQQIINVWTDHAATEFTGQIDLVKDRRYPIMVEYYERASDAVMQLAWSGPGVPKNIIPQSHLFTDGVARIGTGGGGARYKIWLRGGSRVKGGVIGADDKFVDVALDGGVVRFPVESLAVIDFLGWWESPGKEIAGRPPGVLMREGGDFHEAKLESIDEEGVVHTFSPLFGRRSYPTTRLRSLSFGKYEPKTAGQLDIWTREWGWTVRADSIISRGERLIVRDNSGQYINLPLAVISAIKAPTPEGEKPK